MSSINPSQLCDVGKLFGDSCPNDEVRDVSYFSDWADFLHFIQRVEAEAARPLMGAMTTSCSLHFRRFTTFYGTMQLQTGCCNPFAVHSERTFFDLISIDDTFFGLCGRSFPFLIPGRYLCTPCHAIVISWIDRAPRPLIAFPTEFSYNYVNDLFVGVARCHGFSVFPKLRLRQSEAIFRVLGGSHILCVLPTNAGKSGIMIIPGLIYSKITNTRVVTVLIYPLINLMREQYQRIKGWNLDCYILEEGNMKFESFKQLYESSDSGPIYILSNPESLEKPIGKMILTEFRASVKYLMIDEAQQVYNWASEFRPSFGRIGKLRQFLHAKIGLFTGSFVKEMQTQVLKATHLRLSEVTFITDNPDRPEIYIEVKTRSRYWDKDLAFLIEELNSKKTETTRTVIFFSTVENTFEINANLRSILPDGAKVYPKDLHPSYYSQFADMETLDETKPWGHLTDHLSSLQDRRTAEHITMEFAEENGPLRVLLSTIFYGMGMDNPTIDRVVIYDGDDNSASLWQKISRCSRKGQQGHAYIYTTEKQRKKMFVKGQCAKYSILRNLIGYREENEKACVCKQAACQCKKCMCCNICKSKCLCRVTK